MIYLNNASTGFPKPHSVLEAVEMNLRTVPFNYGRSGIARGDKNIVNDTRKKIAEFLNAGDDYHIVFTSGSTEALNLALKGIDLTDKHVIISATEHNSVIRPLMSLKKLKNISISIAECNEFGFVEPANIENLIYENTALICINHCSNVTGTVQDVESISRIAKKHNVLLLIDGSQSAGLVDIDINRFSPDFFSFTGHKSLCGMQGIGGLIFRKSIHLKPLKEGGTGTQSHLLEQPEDFPAKYESGTMNIPGITALEAGISWIQETGIENIRNHKKKLSEMLIDEIKDISGIKIYYHYEKSSGAIVSLTVDDIQPEEINYILANSFEIAVRSGIHCAPLIGKYLGISEGGTLRISPSYFTTEEEIQIFTKAFKKIVRNLRES